MLYRIPLLLSLFFITSCGPSDAELISSAENTVKSFIDDLTLQNYNSAYSVYPEFKKVTKFYTSKEFSISSSRFNNDDKSEVKVSGTFRYSDNASRPVQFVLKRKDKNWEIIRSKGLSSFYESSVFELMKLQGCFSNIESDADIHQECNRAEGKFESMVAQLKESLESLVVFERNGSNLQNDYNISINGQVMLFNSSDVTIPAHTYEIYIFLVDRQGNICHTYKYEFNDTPIRANEFHQINIFAMGYRSCYNSYTAMVKIKNDQFLRKYLANSNILSCSDLK
jgi:hypothetical protein